MVCCMWGRYFESLTSAGHQQFKEVGKLVK